MSALVRWYLGDALLQRAAGGNRALNRAARKAVLEAGDPQALEELARRALDRPDLQIWCARNDIVPADAVTAAALFLLTGQLRRYRAIDPDTALLAEALSAADPSRRGRLLAALARAGDIEPVVAAARQRSSRMVWDLPLAEAAAAVAGFGSWRPAVRTDAALFDRLAAEQPWRVASAVAALPGPSRIDVRGQVADLAFGPQAARLAILHRLGTDRYRLVDAMRGGLGRYEYDLDLGVRTLTEALAVGVTRRVMVHLGDAVLALDGQGIVLFSRGRRQEVYPGRLFHTLAPLGTAGGWVALGGDGRLVLGARGGSVRAGEDRIVDVGPGTRLAAAPDGRHIAVATEDRIVLLDADGREPRAVPWPSGRLEGVAFTGDGRLVALDQPGGPGGPGSRLHRWRIAGGELVEEAVAAVPVARNLEALDGRTLVLDTGEELLHLRDAETFEPRPPIEGSTARIPYPRAAAGFVAVTRHWLRPEHAIDVDPPAAYRLAGRPLSGPAPGDLETLDRHTEPDRGRAWVLGLLRDCLAIRFEADVALGRRADLAEDDIALGVRPPGPA
nr:hypothetical protein GCM10020063_052990 [Dactylosporangium thailandense]